MNTTTRQLLTATFAVATAAVLAGCGSAEPVPVAPAAAVAPASTAAAPTAPARPAGVSDRGADVDADDQSGDGTGVVVREARITAGPGWVAIHTDDDDREQLLGAAPVTPGQTGPITVALDRPVPTADDDLTAVLFADDGDGTFDPQTDPRVLDEDDDDDGDDADDDDIEDDDFDYRVG